MTEEDYQQALKELEEIDKQLDALEKDADSEIKHYASPYYDPVKAHEYYEEHKQLKGRKSTAGLNDDGKEAASYIKSKLNEERDELIDNHKVATNDKIASNKETVNNKISSDRTTMKAQVAAHKEQMQSQITELKNYLSSLDKEEKAAKKESVNEQIQSLRDENTATRTSLQAAFKESSTQLRSNLSTTNSALRTNHTTYKTKVKEIYENKYINELNKLKKESSFLNS